MLGCSLLLGGIPGRLPLISIGQKAPKTRPWLQVHAFFFDLLTSVSLYNYQAKGGGRRGRSMSESESESSTGLADTSHSSAKRNWLI